MSTSVPISALVHNTAPIPQATVKENGRLYYSQWRQIYPYPCDEHEGDRLDALHQLIYHYGLDSLHVASLRPPADGGGGAPFRVLDLGCGTGMWALEFAERYPKAQVIATDVGDVDFRLYNSSPNLEFRPGINFETPVDFSLPPESFDFVHIGQLHSSVSDWPAFLRKILKVLKPGGQLEIVDIDWTPRCEDPAQLGPATALATWWRAMQYATGQLQKPLGINEGQMRAWLQAAGGMSITNHRSERLDIREDSRLPEDDPQRKLARLLRYIQVHRCTRHFESLALALLSRLPDWDDTQVRLLCERVVVEVNDWKCGVYHVLHVWTTRKTH